jgi:hypothetical protein
MPTLAQNIFQSFRSTGSIFTGDAISGGKLSKTFDEPTYLTFRVGFRSANTSLELTNYDKMPHPLFELYKEDDINARNFYSTRQFLRDANEFGREQMLLDFIEKWNTLQNNYQYYFQNISGIDSLLKIDPKRGIRVSKDGKVTMKMLEGLDLRVTHLLNLYRKIAWDDVYQRWILPDMMRYFMMDIYITEFRIFHQSNLKINSQTQSSDKIYPPKQTAVQKYLPELSNPSGKYQSSEVPEMILTAMDDLMPTYVLHCERCEIDITSLNTHFNDLNVSEPSMTEVSFDIKVGTLTEEYRNPLLDYYYTDRIINGLERTREFSLAAGEALPIISGLGIGLIPAMENIPYTPSKISGNTNARPFINPDVDYGQKGSHISGKPFIESGGSGQSNLLNASQAIQPPTWIGNTLTFGKAFAENLLETTISKGKITKIPGLGVSFGEALAAIQSKNVFTVFGLVRQAMTQRLSATMPSQELEGDIIDGAFRAFVSKMSKSKATDAEGMELTRAANQVLSDRGIWEQIKDMSKATDLISQALGEINIGKPLENKNALKLNTEALTNGDRSLATDLGTLKLVGGPLVYNGILTSTSTSGSIDNKGVTRTKLGSTEGEVQNGEFAGTSSTIEGQLQPVEFLGSKPNTGIEEGGLNTIPPSAATSKDGLQPAEFSGSKPKIGIQDGGFTTIVPSLATSKKDILEKGAFIGSSSKAGITEGGLNTSDPGQATKGEIENAKYLFGNVSKKQGITQKAIERRKPGEATDDTKLQPIPRPDKGNINKPINES